MLWWACNEEELVLYPNNWGPRRIELKSPFLCWFSIFPLKYPSLQKVTIHWSLFKPLLIHILLITWIKLPFYICNLKFSQAPSSAPTSLKPCSIAVFGRNISFFCTYIILFHLFYLKISLWCGQSMGQYLNLGSITDWYCDLKKLLGLSEPHSLHLWNRE